MLSGQQPLFGSVLPTLLDELISLSSSKSLLGVLQGLQSVRHHLVHSESLKAFGQLLVGTGYDGDSPL